MIFSENSTDEQTKNEDISNFRTFFNTYLIQNPLLDNVSEVEMVVVFDANDSAEDFQGWEGQEVVLWLEEDEDLVEEIVVDGVRPHRMGVVFDAETQQTHHQGLTICRHVVV